MTDILLQIVKRWLGQSPQFFKVITWAGVAVAIITGLPDLIEYVINFFCDAGVCFELPESVEAIQNKIVSIAAVIGSIISKLTLTTEEKKINNIPE